MKRKSEGIVMEKVGQSQPLPCGKEKGTSKAKGVNPNRKPGGKQEGNHHCIFPNYLQNGK
ncbi:hypothetical protein PGB90_001271 [Kerria lacca]